MRARGNVVVEALCYKRKVAGSHLDEVDSFFQPRYGPGVDSTSNTNVYQES
jgi:hypothetical protein